MRRKQPHEVTIDDLLQLDDAYVLVLSITTHHPDHPDGRVVARVRNRLGHTFDIGLPTAGRVFDSLSEAESASRPMD